ncbi:MAG TPA: hypothetical protein DD456_10155 [Stenotrophomonas sp.]|nr:hypothetical protein [Stenotrophomonas sp.]
MVRDGAFHVKPNAHQGALLRARARATAATLPSIRQTGALGAGWYNAPAGSPATTNVFRAGCNSPPAVGARRPSGACTSPRAPRPARESARGNAQHAGSTGRGSADPVRCRSRRLATPRTRCRLESG